MFSKRKRELEEEIKKLKEENHEQFMEISRLQGTIIDLLDEIAKHQLDKTETLRKVVTPKMFELGVDVEALIKYTHSKL